MANNSFTQASLANDSQFRSRVKAGFSSVAWEVTVEPDDTPNHNNRALYAKQVLRSIEMELNVIMPTFVMRPNVFNFETSYNFESGHTVSATGDPDIMSQLHSDWDEMAAIAGYNIPAGASSPLGISAPLAAPVNYPPASTAPNNPMERR